MPVAICHVSKKKLHWWTRFGKIEIHEQTYRRGRKGRLLRPFSKSADVTCRNYSLGLERALTDFGSDESFAKAVAKVKEHYRIDVAESGVRQATYKYAKNAKQQEELQTRLPTKGASPRVSHGGATATRLGPVMPGVRLLNATPLISA